MTHLTFQIDHKNKKSHGLVVRHGIRCCVAVSRNAAQKTNNCTINAYNLVIMHVIRMGLHYISLKKNKN